MTGTNIDGGRAVIRGQDAGHIRVLRLRPGEDVVICDGRGTDYRCRLVRSTVEESEAEVIEVTPCRGEPDVAVHVFAGYPKGERAELLVQKCVEAGAQEIDFFDCERCIARPDGRAMAKRLGGEKADWLAALERCVPPKFLEMNQKAFELGYQA